jgi:hypothetical protein
LSKNYKIIVAYKLKLFDKLLVSSRKLLLPYGVDIDDSPPSYPLLLRDDADDDDDGKLS